MTVEPARSELPDGKPRVARPLSCRRRWLFRAVAVLLGLTTIVLFEVGLRVAGVGHDLQLIIPVPQSAGWYQLNPRFDEPFFGQADLSGPDGQPFQLPKPAGYRRILVVGGSTVIGFPYTADLAFPRLLQEHLQQQAGDETHIEVLNAGITALNSASEAAVVEEGVACDPDLIVVYTGHNEFYGPGGVASGVGSLDPDWFRWLARWKRCRIVQLARRWLVGKAKPTEELMGRLSADRGILRDSPEFHRAVERFERNLQTMQRAATARRIPLLFVGPVCNERAQPPIEPALVNEPKAGDPTWQADLKKAEHHLRYDQPDKALPLLRSARDAAPESAIVAYRLGQALDQSAEYQAAAEHYAAAVELDGTRFRAPAVFREVMADLATRAANAETHYVDLRAALTERIASHIPGHEHFLEHVHFTWEGNVAVAESLAKFIQQDIWKQEWNAERNPTIDDLREAFLVQPEEHLAAATLAMMVYEKPPFRDSADARVLVKQFTEDTLAAIRGLPAARRELFLDIATAEMAQFPLVALEQRFRKARMEAERGEVLTALVRRRPWNCEWKQQWTDWQRQQPKKTSEPNHDNIQWPCSSP